MPFESLLAKAERFCAYQERCNHEVKQKLHKLLADEKISSKIISSLEEDGYLNDERFAKLFASGKFRIKRWGKNKIRAELRQKKIPDNFISNALDAIDGEEYMKTIQHLINRKERELKGLSSGNRRQKIYRFLLSKGFEPHLVLKMSGVKF